MTQDYATRILQKYGWEKYTAGPGNSALMFYTRMCRGKGLGKEEQGIQTPIVPITQKTTEGVLIFFILHYPLTPNATFPPPRSAIKQHYLSHGGILCTIK